MSTIAPSCTKVMLRLKEHAQATSDETENLYNYLNALADSGQRTKIKDVSKFMLCLQSDSGNTDIGLACYEEFHPGQLQSQLYPLMSSATLGDALLLLSRLSAILSDGAPLLVLEEPDSFSVVFLRLELLNLSRSYIDCYFATLIGIVHWLLPFNKVVPVATTFSYEAPVDTSKLKVLFGENLTFSNLINKITISVHDWNQKLPTGFPELKIHHDNLVNLEIQNFPVKMSSVVKNHIVSGLATGVVVSLESIASAMNLSPRMLRNRLDEEQTGVRELLDESRLQLARHLIGTTDQSSAVIAKGLGFQEVSSFYRACNRWFGCSPAAYRLKAASGTKASG
ncbi:AraC family transcriptional regulator [Pseudomonas sp. B2M1-30]|uniref:AraC family transcriptional regulator n=1 Tax=Pseudomonas TaxID=286 RepID=UPI001C3C49DE|nr:MULTISPECIES: AraC family transcriptional regulator [Pseudomonas]MBV4473595.1 AraC family transcriptional regulator [Pseudomonas botevensis]MCU0117735.1 AraC family transcriptional regulator [Pseudomonas sp. B2M1-30]MCU7259271.1 AraC family transcriptional regulator [Pseudomonas koreensis]